MQNNKSMICTIISSSLSTMEDTEISKIANKLTSSIVLSVLAKPDDKLKLLIDTIIDNNLSDLVLIDDEEVRIKRVFTTLSEKKMDNVRLYFLNTNRIIN